MSDIQWDHLTGNAQGRLQDALRELEYIINDEVDVEALDLIEKVIDDLDDMCSLEDADLILAQRFTRAARNEDEERMEQLKALHGPLEKIKDEIAE